MPFYRSALEIIGNTPLVSAENFSKKLNINANLFVKAESFNPTGSAKDRVAKAIIEDAERNGLINSDTTVIEPTSGNTGIGLAAVCAVKGYKLIITMPGNMSRERISFIKAYGAEVVLTDGDSGMDGAIAKALELNKNIKNSFIAGQFTNPANPAVHFETTGAEIWNDLNGNIDFFIAGVGTGGTLTGAGRYFKNKNFNIKVIAVEPASSPYLSSGIAGKHEIQGIGAGFCPQTLDKSVYDEIITVSNQCAFDTAKNFIKCEGLLVGISSGAALQAAVEIAKRKENAGKNIVIFLPDSGDRYISTELFDN